MTDIIVLGIVAVIVGCAAMYIIKAKKAGAKCIGCPHAGTCASKNSIDRDATAGCGCSCESEESN